MNPQEMPKDYVKNDKLQKTKGKEHADMAKTVGKWKVTTKYAPMFGGGTDVATTTMKLILDGKFLMAEGTGTQMGKPIKTFGLYGYDTLAKEYTAYNLNSIYTSGYEVMGKMREDGVIVYKGIMKDAMSPQGRPYRVEEIKHGDDKFDIVIFDGQGEKEFKVLTMTHERIK